LFSCFIIVKKKLKQRVRSTKMCHSTTMQTKSWSS